MLTGALIGMVVGLVLVVTTALKQKRGGKRVLAALQQGGATARAALDGYVAPPKQGKTSVQRIQELQERFAWLGILGAHDDLEREMALIEGHHSTVGQLRAAGATALLAHRSEPRDLASLQATAAHLSAEGGALLRLVKNIVNDQATVASVLDGKPLDLEATKRVYDRATKSGPAAKIVLLRFLARMTEASGANPANFQREAADALAKLAPPGAA